MTDARCPHERVERKVTGKGNAYAHCPDCGIAFPMEFAARALHAARGPVIYDQEEQR